MAWIQRIGPGAIAFLVLWFGLMLVGRTSLFRDPGTFWHVRTGEILLDSRTFLDREPFSFTFGGTPWTPYEWLAEIGMATVYRFGGFDALLVLTAAGLALPFAMLFVRFLRAGFHPSLAGCLVLLSVATASNHFHARPHVLTILFVAVLVLRLLDVDAGRVRIAGLWWLVPMFAVWANAHGGVLAGYGTAGIAVVGWLALRAIGWPTPVQSRFDALHLAAWLAAVGGTVLVNPYGFDLPRVWLHILDMPELKSIISEHRPIDPGEPSAWAFFLLFAAYLVALAGLREKPRMTWLLPLVWFALGCDRVRHTSLFAVVAAAAIADLFPRTVWAKKLAIRPDLYRFPEPDRDPPAVGPWGVALIASLVLGLLASTHFARDFDPRWVRFDEEVWPMPLIADLHRESAGRDGVAIFNEYALGGFLIHFAPEYRPFVDDRCEVYGGRWLVDYVDAQNGDAGPAMSRWEASFPKFDLAIAYPHSGFGRYFANSQQWKKVGETEHAALYRRVTP